MGGFGRRGRAGWYEWRKRGRGWASHDVCVPGQKRGAPGAGIERRARAAVVESTVGASISQSPNKHLNIECHKKIGTWRGRRERGRNARARVCGCVLRAYTGACAAGAANPVVVVVRLVRWLPALL